MTAMNIQATREQENTENHLLMENPVLGVTDLSFLICFPMNNQRRKGHFTYLVKILWSLHTASLKFSNSALFVPEYK
jgi:hypothetical protein